MTYDEALYELRRLIKELPRETQEKFIAPMEVVNDAIFRLTGLDK